MRDAQYRPEFLAAHARVEATGAASMEQVRRTLRLSSFSDTGEGIAETALYFTELLSRIAPDARSVPTAGHPVVMGRVPAAVAGAPTLIVYGLYDVTPTIPEEWTVDPLAAHVVDARDLGLLPHLGAVIVGRGANNHKGPVVATILAVEALRRSGCQLPMNLVFVIEGEEEIGSPSLPGFVEENRAVLESASGVWLPCMQQNSVGTMTLRRGYKGCLFAHLSCRGGKWGGTRDHRHIWAGNSAWIDAPMMQLVRALATMFDDQQRVTIDGLDTVAEAAAAQFQDEAVRISTDFRNNPRWASNMLTNLNVGAALSGKEIADHIGYSMTGVTMNIQGIKGGYQGPTFYTMMAGEASARIDLRFPPGIGWLDVASAIRSHLNRRQFQHISVENSRGYDGSPPLDPGTDVLLASASRTAERYGVDTAVWPIANNCCPAALFTTVGSQIPFSVAGLGHGDRAHAPDEYITVGSVDQLMHFTIDHLGDVAEELNRC